MPVGKAADKDTKRGDTQSHHWLMQDNIGNTAVPTQPSCGKRCEVQTHGLLQIERGCPSPRVFMTASSTARMVINHPDHHHQWTRINVAADDIC